MKAVIPARPYEHLDDLPLDGGREREHIHLFGAQQGMLRDAVHLENCAYQSGGVENDQSTALGSRRSVL